MKLDVKTLWDITVLREIEENGRKIQKVVQSIKANPNLVTTEGKNALLDIMFHASTQISTWYLLIFESNTDPVASMTYASPVFTECTAYNETARPEFVESASSNGSLSNSASKATFTINDTKTIYGSALVGGGSAPSTKGNTAGGGVLFSVSKFTSPISVVANDVIQVVCTINA